MRAPLQNRNRKHQEGNILIMASIVLSTTIILLASIDIGFLFYQKRELQKIADMAAIAGAQQLTKENGCISAQSTAIDSAKIAHNFPLEPNVTIGQWDPKQDPIFSPSVDCNTLPNAVRVEVNRTFGSFFGAWASQSVHANAIATSSTPLAAFSIGSSLVELDTSQSVLGQLFDSTLGTQLGLRLLSSQGLVNTQIRLLELIDLALETSTVDSLLNSQLTVESLLNAIVDVLDKRESNDVQIDLTLIRNEITRINTQIGNVELTLGELLNVNANTTNPNTILNTNLAVTDLISVILQAANKHHALTTDSDINLSTLAKVNLKLAIVEPPKIGIGGPGATAHTAQVRLKLDLKLLNATQNSNIIDLNVLGLARIRLGADAGQTISLPLNLEIAPGTATLDTISCLQPPSPLQHKLDMSAVPGIAHIFLGNLDAAYNNSSASWNTLVANAISDRSAFADLLSLRLRTDLLFGLIEIADVSVALRAYANIPIDSQNAPQSLHYSVNPNVPVIEQNLYSDVSSNQQLLDSVRQGLLTPSNLVIDRNAITDLKIIGINLSLLQGIVNALLGQITTITSWLVGLLSTLLDPVFNLLDILLAPLLNGLGINIGNAQVRLLDISCNNSVRLVH